MDFQTLHHWNEQIWNMIQPIYHQAFGGKGAKPKKVIMNMFQKKLCYLHIGMMEGQIVALALTGKLIKQRAILIDYLAVDQQFRNKGFGGSLVAYIQDWAVSCGFLEGLIIEVESEETQENKQRIAFWKNCGFVLTDYIHQYIWVPEPYQAMYKKLKSDSELSEDGQELFKYIGQFHKACYHGV